MKKGNFTIFCVNANDTTNGTAAGQVIAEAFDKANHEGTSAEMEQHMKKHIALRMVRVNNKITIYHNSGTVATKIIRLR